MSPCHAKSFRPWELWFTSTSRQPRWQTQAAICLTTKPTGRETGVAGEEGTQGVWSTEARPILPSFALVVPLPPGQLMISWLDTGFYLSMAFFL